MSKRLSRSDYIFTLIFIFMLVLTIAAFFYGLKTGKENAEAKYEQWVIEKDEIPAELTAYDQQYLVSFYHTIYLPYRDFQKKWFDHMDSIDLRRNTTNVKSVFDELGKLANEQYEQMINKSMPDISPLLVQSHEDYLKSLKLFAEAVKQDHLIRLEGTSLLQEIEKDVFFQQAIEFGLSAQSKYYESIVMWDQFNRPQTEDQLEFIVDELNIEQWKALNLNEKNSVIAKYMSLESFYELYYVHDVTIRIDELIQTGQAKKMNLKLVKEVMDTLINTRAIRLGDFLNNKERYYEDELLPQLPFFFE